MSDQFKNEKDFSSFAVYIDEKLSKFEKKTRMYIKRKKNRHII